MFVKKLENIFLIITFIAVIFLVKNYYDSYIFKTNDIPDSYKKRITDKEQEILNLMRDNYGVVFKVPIIITDEFKGKLYGATVYKDSEVSIYLNKNVMQESMDYMINSVLAHEYAHALIFKLGLRADTKDGHTKEWKEACENLGGINCEQYVNIRDVTIGKLPF